MFESLLNAFRAPDLRRRLLYVAGILILFRFLSHVPVPGVDHTALANFFNGNALFGLLDLFSGGGLSTFSIVGLGMNPYINASIIMQLMKGVIPSLQTLSREGEYGRNKLNQYTRILAVPMALLSSYGFLALLTSQNVPHDHVQPVELGDDHPDHHPDGGLDPADVPRRAHHREGHRQRDQLHHLRRHRRPRPARPSARSWRRPDLAAIVIFALIGLVAIFVIIYIQEGQRRIPIQYASRVRGRRMYQGGSTFLPLRVNQAGVIPIIFAISILLFPTQIASYFPTSTIGPVADISKAIVGFLDQHGAPYLILYFVLTVGFTYFYTAFTFKPDETAEQLRKNGGFIPGHPAGPADPGLPARRSSSGSRSPARSSWAPSPSPRRSSRPSCRPSAGSAWAAPACSSS